MYLGRKLAVLYKSRKHRLTKTVQTAEIWIIFKLTEATLKEKARGYKVMLLPFTQFVIESRLGLFSRNPEGKKGLQYETFLRLGERRLC